ncbi:MAG: flagellar rod assembly protein/muramidase FlgJ, partial [Candidatus Sedimenticola endophacoides]
VRQLGGLAPSQAEGSAAGRGIGAYPRRPPVLSVVPRPRAAEDGAPPEREIALATPHTTAPAAGEPVTDPAGWSKGEFVERLLPWAREAAALLGLQPEALLAQAALETGWGRRMVRFSDGAPAHNLFGIKADRRWQGNKVAVNTLEYEQGVAVRHRAYFRAYDSFRDSFSDYVRFLRQSPRYQGALALAEDPAAYFGELQRAGYATDPAYARKITRILEDEVLRGEAVDNSTARPL